MGDQWVPVPPQFPHRCHRTGQSEEADGPFFCEGWWFAELVEPGHIDDREHQLIHSAQWIREMCEAPGSPFVLLTKEKSEELAVRLAQAQDRILALEADIAGRPEEIHLAQIDFDALDERYAKKTGPKPKAPA